MLSKTLIKLIDYSIFPAVLIIAAKMLSIVFLLRYFDVNYYVDSFRLVLTSISDFNLINTYSSLFAFITIISGLTWVTIKAHLFHDTHITPSLSSRLFGMNLQEIIHDNEVIYSQSFIWLSYCWLATIMFAVNSYFGFSQWWLVYLAAGISVLATSLLSIDVERETRGDFSKATELLSKKALPAMSLYDLRKSWE